jgi:hypothetical protein
LVSAWIAVVLTGGLATAVVSLVLWLMWSHERGLGRDIRWSLRHEVSRWSTGRGWIAQDDPAAGSAGPFDPRVRPGHEILIAAEGELVGRRAVLLVCRDEDEDGAPAYTTAVVRVPGPLPTLEIRQRYVVATLWKAQNPTPSDPSAGDVTFHRRLKMGLGTGPDASALLTDPVRAALLRLHEMGYGKREFVDLRDGYLEVLVARWPPALILDRFVEVVSDLVLELAAAASTPPSAQA